MVIFISLTIVSSSAYLSGGRVRGYGGLRKKPAITLVPEDHAHVDNRSGGVYCLDLRRSSYMRKDTRPIFPFDFFLPPSLTLVWTHVPSLTLIRVFVKAHHQSLRARIRDRESQG